MTDGLQGAVVELVLMRLNTWDVSKLTVAVSREWREASIAALQRYPSVVSNLEDTKSMAQKHELKIRFMR